MDNQKRFKNRKHWIKLSLRFFKKYINQSDLTNSLVKTDYDKIAEFYDAYWTEYMHGLSENMLKSLNPPKNCRSLDLTCGTGFVSSKLFEITEGDVTGVDISEGMIKIAQENYGNRCRFIQADVLEYLKKQPSNSYDIITCAWGLGYLPSSKLFKEISRVINHGGKIGIIDNSTFSNWEVIWFLILALAEKPYAFKNIIKSHYLLTNISLALRMKLNGIKVIEYWKGEKIYKLSNGKKAMEQFIRSGAAAGILQIIDDKYEDEIINRVGELLIRYKGKKNIIPIVHRYIAAVGIKK